MKMHPVISSKIDVIGYDEQTHKLRVSFRKEKPRDFCHVPENTFTAFLNARSKDRFFKRNIEDSFPCWANKIVMEGYLQANPDTSGINRVV
jgi:hypothetical protein